MDFNTCLEHIQVYTNYLMAPIFPTPNCEAGGRKNSLARRGDGHMQESVINMAPGIPYMVCNTVCQVPCVGKCQCYRNAAEGRT